MNDKEKIDKVKKEILSSVNWEQMRPQPTGGQTVGIIDRGVRLSSNDIDIEIAVGFHRSQFANKELAMLLFSLALDELIK